MIGLALGAGLLLHRHERLQRRIVKSSTQDAFRAQVARITSSVKWMARDIEISWVLVMDNAFKLCDDLA
jgi:hypothetical protein